MSDLTEKLCKLIPRLASDNHHEVLATVRAIGKTLKAAGRDFNDLGGMIADNRSPAFDGHLSDDGTAWRGGARSQPPPGATFTINLSEARKMADEVIKQQNTGFRLSNEEKRFMHDLKKRLDRNELIHPAEHVVLERMYRNLWP